MIVVFQHVLVRKHCLECNGERKRATFEGLEGAVQIERLLPSVLRTRTQDKYESVEQAMTNEKASRRFWKAASGAS